MVLARFSGTLVVHGLGASIARLSPFAGHGGHRLVGSLDEDGTKTSCGGAHVHRTRWHVLIFSGITQSDPIQFTIYSRVAENYIEALACFNPGFVIVAWQRSPRLPTRNEHVSPQAYLPVTARLSLLRAPHSVQESFLDSEYSSFGDACLCRLKTVTRW